MAKNRSDRDAWHLMNKLMPILAVMTVIGMGYLLFTEVATPMIKSIVAGFLAQN